MTRVRRGPITKLKLAVAVSAFALLVTVPAIAAESITQAVNGGDRSASVQGANLGSVGYSHEDQVSAGSLTIQVDDSSGTDAGWNVTLQSGDFTDGDKVIDASNFAIVNASAPGHVVGQGIDAAGGPKVPASGAFGSLESPRKVLQANAGYGKGTYTQQLDVELTVPGQTLAGDYGANLTVNITAGP